MKTIYINKSALQSKELKESILKDSLPLDIIDSISRNSTSLGDNPSIPEIYDVPFLLKVSSKRFNAVKDELKELGEIDDVEGNDIKTVFSKLIIKCKKIENKYKNELEKICFNYVVDLFGIPDNSVSLNVNLVDNVKINNDSIILDPIDGDDELNDVESGVKLRNEVMKRRILDSLCMGFSMKMSENIGSFADEINKVDPNLCDLYKKILLLENYLLFEKEDLELTEEDKKQLGTVVFSFGDETQIPKIESQGVIFPVLLCETIRGIFELFVSHGLPDDRNMANMVIGKADFLKAEPWDMRIGPYLWELFSDSFDNIDTEELPYLIKRVSMLDTDNFSNLFKEIFAKTKKGKKLMSYLCYKAKDDFEYDSFADKMDKMNTDKGIITDDYIHPNEL